MISVIICTYNREKLLEKTIECLAKQIFSDVFDVVVVDNGSTDGTLKIVSILQETYPDLPLRYVMESNLGLSYARNTGVYTAKGEIIAMIDDDAFAEPD